MPDTRTVHVKGKAYDVPFIVCGDGGHHVNMIVRANRGEAARKPHFGTKVSYLDVNSAIETSGLLLQKYNDRGYGYLRISADLDQAKVIRRPRLLSDNGSSYIATSRLNRSEGSGGT